MIPDNKNCVACAESIRGSAMLCRFCGTKQDDPRFTNQALNHIQDSDSQPNVNTSSTSLLHDVNEVQKDSNTSKLNPAVSKENSRTSTYAILGGVSAVAIVLGVLISGAGRGPDASSPPGANQNENLIFQPLRSGDIPFTSLSPGMCLMDANLEEGFDYEGLPGAMCDEPHDSEVTKIGVLNSTTWPISESTIEEVVRECEKGFDDYTGLKYQEEREWEIGTYFPSKREWDKGDRIYVCVLFRADGTRIVDSMARYSQLLEGISGGLSIREIYEKALPSVVTVECGEWQGTGFAYDVTPASGYSSVIVTNHHVISDCTFTNGPGVEIVTSANIRPESELWTWDEENDLALIMTKASLPIIQDAKPAEIGDQVVAIGSPLGFSGTITTGIISQVYPDAYQTDAAINPGNSGGPLLDMRGNLLGVNTIGYGREGLNIAFRPELLCQKILNCG